MMFALIVEGIMKSISINNCSLQNGCALMIVLVMLDQEMLIKSYGKVMETSYFSILKEMAELKQYTVQRVIKPIL